MKWNIAFAALIAITPVAVHSQQAPYSGQQVRAIKGSLRFNQFSANSLGFGFMIFHQPLRGRALRSRKDELVRQFENVHRSRIAVEFR